jgi:hypothetical protein
VVMMVNSVLSLLPMGSDETTVLHYALHLWFRLDWCTQGADGDSDGWIDGQTRRTDGRIEHSRLF